MGVLRRRRIVAAPGTTERVVEIPWTLSRYRNEPTVLDIGSSFAEQEYVDALMQLGIPSLVGVDPAPPVRALPFEVVSADVRQLPFPDGWAPLIFCISTLEHIGKDNSVYGLPAESDLLGMASALCELRRILTPDGRLLVTVPCGELEDHGWFVQQPPEAWWNLFTGAGWAVTELEVYELGEEGWWLTRRFFAEGVRYGTRGPAASAVLCATLTPG